MNEVIQAVFVAWQDPVQRRFWPVARLAIVPNGNCTGCYEFCYIGGIDEAREYGFQPFLAFPEVQQVYRSRELFPLFANRLMSPSRLDYPQYIERLGLDPATSTPMSVLARSGGRRTTDSVELFPLPAYEPEGGYRTFFLAHAVRHLPEPAQSRLLRLVPGERLYLMRDCQNQVDQEAIAVRTDDRMLVGYMPGYLLEDAHQLAEACSYLAIFVDRVNPPPAPLEHRLLCRFEGCWPDGFIPFSTCRYQPVSNDAALVSPAALQMQA